MWSNGPCGSVIATSAASQPVRSVLHVVDDGGPGGNVPSASSNSARRRYGCSLRDTCSTAASCQPQNCEKQNCTNSCREIPMPQERPPETGMALNVNPEKPISIKTNTSTVLSSGVTVGKGRYRTVGDKYNWP